MGASKDLFMEERDERLFTAEEVKRTAIEFTKFYINKPMPNPPDYIVKYWSNIYDKWKQNNKDL